MTAFNRFRFKSVLILSMGASLAGAGVYLEFPGFAANFSGHLIDTDHKAESTGFTGFETGTKILGFEEAWRQNYTGQGQVIGMTDTGLDVGNDNAKGADLNLLLPPDLKKVKEARSFSPTSTSWSDPDGHGTAMAGLMVGNGAMSRRRIRGGAFNAWLVVQSLWSYTRPTTQKHEWMIDYPKDFTPLLEHSYAHGARIHNLSIGSWSPETAGVYESNAQQIDGFIWKNQDILVVIAAGNTGVDQAPVNGLVDRGSISPPGASKNGLTVGSSENIVEAGGFQKTYGELNPAFWPLEPIRGDHISDNVEGLAAFSARGPTRDGRIKPDLVAPGTNVVSTRSQHPMAGTLWGERNDHYIYTGGTSASAALASAAAVISREFMIREHMQIRPTAALVKAGLIHTAKRLGGQYAGEVSSDSVISLENLRNGLLPKVADYAQGYGRIDLSALMQLKAGRAHILDHPGLLSNEVYIRHINISEKSNLKATLVYSDIPGLRGGDHNLMNDLDLLLENIGTKQVYSLRDRRNNVEKFEVKVQPGRYRVVVHARKFHKVTSGRQPFALIISQSK